MRIVDASEAEHRRNPGMGRATAVLTMVGAALGAVALVAGGAVLASAAGAGPLLVAATATFTAGTGGYLLATTAATVRRLRMKRDAFNDRATSSVQLASPQIVRAEGHKLALLDLGHEISTALRREFDQGLVATGRPFQSGGPLGHACLPLAGAGAGAGIATSLAAGNVFVATADPATLMRIGKSVGSAIMGPKGIVGAAPFLPAAAPLMPVVAPVLLLTTFSSMVMAVRFDRIEKTLTGLAAVLDYLLADKLAEDAARFLSAWERLSDIHEEYSKGPGFTDEMKVRLGLIERDVKVLRHKHHFLATKRVTDARAAKLSENDKRLFVASSVADVQVDQLRLLLSLQDNPADAARRLSALQKKVHSYESDFRSLVEKNPVEQFKGRLERSVDEMGWWNKLLGKDKAIEAELGEIGAATNPLALDEPVPEAERPESDPASHYSILMWRDTKGTDELRAWYTNDYTLTAHTEPERSPEANGPGDQAPAR